LQQPKIYTLGKAANVLLFVFILVITVGCKSQPVTNDYILTNSERVICDSLQIDSVIIKIIRKFNTNAIERFHYSLGKSYENGIETESDPIFLQGLVFSEINSKSYELVFRLKESFAKKGYCIFMLENNFNIGNKLDNIAVLKTTDKFEILKSIGTDGINFDITNDSLISLIKDFDKKYSLELIGASGDWCEFIIHKEPKDWTQFAKEVYKVCPDVVDQGTDTIKELANEMQRSKRLYFWWD